MCAMLDLGHLAVDALRHSPQDRDERDKEQHEHDLEDGGDWDEGGARRARDRCVVLVDDDDAGAARHRDRRIGTKCLQLLAAGGERGHVAADGAGERLADVCRLRRRPFR